MRHSRSRFAYTITDVGSGGMMAPRVGGHEYMRHSRQ